MEYKLAREVYFDHRRAPIFFPLLNKNTEQWLASFKVTEKNNQKLAMYLINFTCICTWITVNRLF